MPDRYELETRFLGELPRIERIIGALCRRHGLDEEAAEDFASWAKLRLIENDYVILQKFRGESSLATYLTVVLAMLFSDFRVQRWGRWRPSAEARRRGPVAVRLETLVYRDGHSLAYAAEHLRSAGVTTLSDRALAQLLVALPVRAPLRPRPSGHVALDDLLAPQSAEANVLHEEACAERDAIERLMEDALQRLPAEDQAIVRLRFWEGLSLAEVARALGLAQKPLYRRFERVLAQVRSRLGAAGISPEQVRTLLEDREEDPGGPEDSSLLRPSTRETHARRPTG